MKESTKTNLKLFLGILFIFISFGSDWSHIFDWSTPENIGFNISVLFWPILGTYLLYSGYKESKLSKK